MGDSPATAAGRSAGPGSSASMDDLDALRIPREPSSKEELRLKLIHSQNRLTQSEVERRARMVKAAFDWSAVFGLVRGTDEEKILQAFSIKREGTWKDGDGNKQKETMNVPLSFENRRLVRDAVEKLGVDDFAERLDWETSFTWLAQLQELTLGPDPARSSARFNSGLYGNWWTLGLGWAPDHIKKVLANKSPAEILALSYHRFPDTADSEGKSNTPEADERALFKLFNEIKGQMSYDLGSGSLIEISEMIFGPEVKRANKIYDAMKNRKEVAALFIAPLFRLQKKLRPLVLRVIEVKFISQMDAGLSVIRSSPHLRDIQVDDHSAVLELETDDRGVAGLLNELIGQGVGIRSFGEKEPTLEDVFMLVTKGLVT